MRHITELVMGWRPTTTLTENTERYIRIAVGLI